IDAKLISVDESTAENLGAKVVRMKDFLAVVAADEWMAVRAARALRAQWSEWSGLPEQDTLEATLRNAGEITDEILVNCRNRPSPRGQRRSPLVTSGRCRATPHLAPPAQWPMCALIARQFGLRRKARMAIAGPLPDSSVCRQKRCGSSIS